MALVVKNSLANARDVRDEGSVPGLERSPGGGHRNPVQYSYLENSMDWGAWQAVVHRVTKSRTHLKQFITHSMHTLARSLEIIILASLCILPAVFYLPLKPRALNLTPVSLILLGLHLEVLHVCQSLSRVRLFATPWAVVHQTSQSMGFSSQEYWNEVPFPSPGNLPHPGIEPTSLVSPALAN